MLIIDATTLPSPRRPWHRFTSSPHMRLALDVARLTHHWESCADIVFHGQAAHDVPRSGLIEGVQLWFVGAGPPMVAVPRRIRELVEFERAQSAEGAPGMMRGNVVVTSNCALGREVFGLGAAVVSDVFRRALDRVCGAADLGMRIRTPLFDGPRALLGMQMACARAST